MKDHNCLENSEVIGTGITIIERIDRQDSRIEFSIRKCNICQREFSEEKKQPSDSERLRKLMKEARGF